MIRHEIRDNKVIIRAELELKLRFLDPRITIDKKTIEEYIKENDVPAGSPISDHAVAGNWSKSVLTAEWTYQISKEEKKRLTSSANNVKLNKQKNKKVSPRARAKKIVETRKEQADVEKPKRVTTSRKRTTKRSAK